MSVTSIERTRRHLAILLTFMGMVGAAQAQTPADWNFSGQFFGDYQMLVQSADGETDGQDAFQIRRIFFTADFPLGEKFDGRFRVEATNRNVIDGNRSVPFLKDVYLRWKNIIGPGHHLYMGLSAPPMWQVSQRFWSYRALARTVQHRAGIAGPRDTGLALHGPLNSSGSTRYGVMVGNNNQGAGETDDTMRFYSQIDTDLTDNLLVAGSFTYHTLPDGQSYNGNLLLGWHQDNRTRVAAEVFYNARPLDGQADRDAISGASLYGWHFVSEATKVILRGDLTRFEEGGTSADRTWFFAGISYSPERNVEVIPNIMIQQDDRADQAEITARLTLYANF